MEGMMYVIGLVLALLAGFQVTKNPDRGGRRSGDEAGPLGEARTSYGRGNSLRREGWRLFAGPVVVHLAPLAALLVVVMVVLFVMDMTYAHYIGSVRSFLAFALAASILGLVVSMVLRSVYGETDLEDVKQRLQGRGRNRILGFAMVLIVVMLMAVALGGALASICVVPLIVLLLVLAIIMLRLRRLSGPTGGRATLREAREGMAPHRWPDGVRLALVVLSLIILVTSSFLSFIAPSALDDNDLYASVEGNTVRGENNVTLEDPQEVRVVSWLLATQYLQRSYGDAAAYLDTSETGLLQYTDPSLVDGKFVWVNAPVYEAWKWFGGKKVPFFVYVVNDPANITENATGITHRVSMELETHYTRITWQKRLEQLTFARYAAEYEIAQVRFTIDDDENPYWIVYLARRDTWFNRLYLERLLVVNAEDMEDNTEYGVTDDDIPEWLEVVYPDWYVYDWVRFWADYRMGIGYKWFNKAHLYEPDDDSARFIVIQGETYWQIPLVQKNSHVLGGYVWVHTRTGEATFFNREDRSLADKDTVEAQIQTFLLSGVLGYQRLAIHEGYLYPVRLDDGTVREAYIFPLYAGLTIQKYAVVDAEDYSREPYVESDLPTALDRYRARSGGGGGDLVWEEFTMVTGVSEADAAVVTLDNATWENHTLVIERQALEQGLLARADDEMREVNLAIAAWGRGEDVVLRLVFDGGVVVDADWEGSDLVP